MSRPKIPIDWKRVDEFLVAGAEGTEVAAYFGMHPDTFYRRVEEECKIGFTELMQQKRSKGHVLLRNAQLDKAINSKDSTMLIWLGKQKLGQKESVNEFKMSQEMMKPFEAIMGQITNLQLDRKRELSSDNNAPKSE